MHAVGTVCGCSVRVWCACSLHPVACDATMGCTRQPHPRKDSGSARNQHRPHCIRARAPSTVQRRKAVHRRRQAVHRTQAAMQHRAQCTESRQCAGEGSKEQQRKCSRALALRSGCRMRSAIYRSSIAALCGLGSPPAAGFGRLAAVHSTNPAAALYPYSACATWDDSGDQRLRVGWLVGWYARTVPSSVRLQKRYLVGTKNIEYN